MYNSGMGGVDICHHILSSYKPRFRFKSVLDLSVIAAYKCYLLANPNQKMSHVKYRREVTRTLLASQTDRTHLGGPSCAPASLIQFDGVNHFLERYTQERCFKCQKNTKFSCVTCNKR